MIERFTLLSVLNPITYFQKHIPIIFLLFCLLPGFTFAQPANDDCGNATNITDVSGGCSIYDFTGATADLLNGSCAVNGVNSVNTWFQFVAIGSELTITSNTQGGSPLEITVIEFTPNPCVFGDANQIACSQSPLTATGLSAGTPYYVVISDPSNGAISNYNVCVTSEVPNPPPGNDDPCNAFPATPDGSCTNGTTVNATSDWTVGDPACAGLAENSVWYTTTLGPNMDQLDVDVQGAGGSVMAIVGTFAPDCLGTFNIEGYDCGSGGPFSVTGLTPGIQYWVLVSTAAVSEGPFSVCLTESGLPPGCSGNDLCANATSYPTPTTGSPCTPLNGCNIGANPEPGLTGCNFATEEVVWFTFNSDATAGLLSASVVANNPTTMSQPSIQIFNGGCGGPVPISDCASGSNGQVTLVNETIAPNQTYLVAVSNVLGEGGYFDLCLQTFADLSACATESNLYVSPGSPSFGSPDNGPYQPGEMVTMCFDLINYHADQQGVGNNCQWLQGIVPIFGDCWDPTGFDPTLSTPPSLYGGNWNWHTDITYNTTNPNISIADCDGDGDTDICHITEPGCCNTGTNAGTIIPPGWFADMGGSPNNTFGDGNCCNCDMGPWSFCFDLVTKPYPECDANPSFTDCSVKVFTFADGETGSWQGGPSICAQDVPQINTASLNCCEGPTVDYQEAEVCSGEALFFNLTSNQPNVVYNWTVTPTDAPPNPNIYGAFSGSGPTINQTLTNDTGAPVTVIYTVSGTNTTEGCVGFPTEFFVTVYPTLEVTVPNVLPVCAGECADIEAFITGGSGTYISYMWDQGVTSGAPTANVCPTTTTTYSVTVTDLLGCTGEGSVTVAANSGLIIDITPAPAIESCIDFNNPATATATVTQGGSGVYGYEWEGAVTGAGGASESEVIFDSDTYTVTITDFITGCTGTQSIDMIINPLPFIVIIDPDALCESDIFYCFDVFVDNAGFGGVGMWGGEADVNGCINPQALGDGNFQVSYEWTDYNGCYDIAVYDFVVDPVPDAPDTLADATLCSGVAPQMYTVPAVPGAFTYTWTVPTGATITAGQTTNSITVDWTGSLGGQVCVTADNDCGSSLPSCFNITIGNTPATPVAPADVSFCDNDPMQSFSITAVPGASSYIWTVPAGASITGGQTTADIMVNWGTAGSGQVCVTASNACGTSAQACANVTVLTAPVAPTPPANVTICAGATGQVYTVADVPTATGYSWTVPTGATITAGLNTASITVDWAANATTGQICVTADNACGASAPGCFDVTVGTIPATPTPPANSTVCFGETGVAYNVAAVTFADDYTWTVPTGATIASGDNTNAITINWGTATSGQVCVTANNSCGSSPQACFDITVDEIPVTPETLPDVTVCATTTGDMFTVATVTGATNYTWTVPGGSSIASGQTTNEIEVDWGTTSGQVCVTANNNCGSSPQACFNVVVDEIPVEPTPPNDAIICAGLAGDTYMVPTVTGALTYTWTVPAGATIASGQTTNSIDIDWGTATSGQVCITADNNCGSSAPACFDVMIGDVPPIPTPPANSNVCAATANSNYAIAPVADATGYVWTIPTGATITNGDNTTSINVDWGTATSGDICVTATNSCGDSPEACFTVTVDDVPPAPAAAIDAIICAGAEGEIYTVADVSGATSYTWTVPNGASIVDGLGTTEIEVDWAANATSDQICVTADNDCGMSPQTCFNVTINEVPAAAVVPTDATICENLQGDVYTIADVANANAYAWTVPAGATIASGQNSTSIEIGWGTAGGDVCVTPSNDCGDGPETCFAILVNITPQPPIAPQDPTVCQGVTGDVYSINPVAGATSYTWTVPANASITNGIDSDEITIDWGTATSGQVCVTANNDCGSSTPACFDVTVDEVPGAPIAPADAAVCAGTLAADYSILPVPGANTYTWSAVGGATITGGQNTTNITVDYDNSADATICVTADNDCGSSAPVCFTTTINPIPTADFTVVSPICNISTSTVTYTGTASANATYTWNFNGGTNTTNAVGAGPYEIEWAAGGTYTVSLTVSENTCESTPVTMDVEVEVPLAVPVINCNTTTSSIEFTWADIPGATGYLVNGVPNVGTSYELTGLPSGQSETITVTALGDGPCGDSEATQTCLAEDCPIVDVAIDAVAPICLDANTNMITLNVVVTGTVDPGSGTWSGTGIEDATLGTFDPNTANVGNNAITYTYTEGPCMYSQSIDIVVNSQPTADFTVPSPICAEDTVTVNYIGTATATATYNWDFGNADYADGTGAGPYEVHWPAGADQMVTLTVTSLAGCPSETMSEMVTIDAPLAVPNIICNSSTDNIEFTWDAVVGATEYLVNNIAQPGTSYSATGLDAGDMVTITVIAVGNGSCGNSQATQTCTADDCPPVNINIDPVADICLDASATAINLNAVVSGPGTGQWSGPGIEDATTGLFNPNAVSVSAGPNTITYNYVDGTCTASQSIDIIIIPQPTASFSVDPNVCAGDNVTVAIAAGTFNAVATYVWDFGNGTVVNDLGSEIYEVQMSTAATENITLQVIENGCASDLATEIVDVDAPLAVPVITCETTTTSITFSWDAIPGANGYTVNNVPQGGTTYTVSGLNTGDMETITVVALGTGACGNSEATQTCTAEDCPNNITVTIDPVTEFCVGDGPINLNAIVMGGTGGSGLWTGNGITDQVMGTFDPNALGVDIGPNQITYTYSEPPCNFPATIDIIVNEVPSAAFVMDVEACIGDLVNVSLQGTASGTATYNWNFGNGVLIDDLGQESYNIQFPVGGSQDVSLEVIDNGCNSGTETESIQIDEPLPIPNITCNPTLNSVDFTWDAIPGVTEYIVNGALQTDLNFEFTGLAEGDEVSVTVIAVGTGPCGNSEATEICEASACPPVNLVIDPVGDICEMATPTGMIDLEVTITGSNGTGIGSWSGTGIVNTTTGMFNPDDATLISGPNTVTYSFEEDGCDFSESIVINVFDLPSANAGPTAELSCNNGNITTLSGSGSGTPMWSGGTYDSGQDTYNPVVTSPGIYTLTVTDASGCTNTATVEITADPSVPVATSLGDLILDCNNNTTVTLQANGTLGPDYQVTWTGPSINAGNINDESITLSQASDAGNYSFIITNTNLDCESEPAFIDVGLDTLPPNAIIQFTGSLDCTGGVELSTVIEPNTTVSWEDPEGTITLGSPIEALTEGTYILYVVNNINGCDNFSTIEIEDNTAYPIANAGEDQELDCTNPSVTLDGSGSQMGPTITLTWSTLDGVIDGPTDQPTATATAPGTYTLTTLDTDNGCTENDIVVVTEDTSAPVAEAGDLAEFGCADETVSLSGSGTTGADTYIWTDANGTILTNSVNYDAIEPGTYFLEVINSANQCNDMDSVVVNPATNFPSAIDPIISPPSCFGDTDGFINIVGVTGGTAPYMYSIDGAPFSTFQQFSFLEGDMEYDITIEDADGCTFETELFVPQPTSLDIIFNTGLELDYYPTNLGDESITLDPTYSIPNGAIDTLIWSPIEFLNCPDSVNCYNPQTDSMLFYSTTYSVTMIDTFGCSITREILVEVNKDRPVYIPNAFSPNADGANDFFEIYPGDTDRSVEKVNFFRIFNRWGEIVHEAEFFRLTDPKAEWVWDGTFKGEPLNPGVFVYVTEIEFVDGFKVLYKGDVTIKK